jgi:hypothetical protein
MRRTSFMEFLLLGSDGPLLGDMHKYSADPQPGDKRDIGLLHLT